MVGVPGILKAGGAYVPIDPLYPANRVAFILEDAGAPVLVTQHSLLASLPKTQSRHILLDEPLPSPAHAPSIPPPVSSDNLAYVIYTSGSTGNPKGVQIEHRAVINFLTSMRQEPGMKANDIVLSLTTASGSREPAFKVTQPLMSHW